MFFRMIIAAAALLGALAAPAMAQTATTPTYSVPGGQSDYTYRSDGAGGVVLTSPTRGINGLPGSPSGIYIRFANDRWYWDGRKLVAQFAAPGAAQAAPQADTAAAEARGYARGVQAAVDALGKLRGYSGGLMSAQ